MWEKSRLLSLTKRLLKLRKQSGITKRAVCSLLEHFIKYFYLFFFNNREEERGCESCQAVLGQRRLLSARGSVPVMRLPFCLQ